jgi:hypothetical protein
VILPRESFLPISVISAMQKYVTRVATKVHNTFERQDSICRDAVYVGLSLDTSLVGRLLCLFVARTLVYTFAIGESYMI